MGGLFEFGTARREWMGTGVQPPFQSSGVQFLGLGYCAEQNTDDIPSFVHCSLLRNGNHTLHQKSWGGPSKFWVGVRTPPAPQWLHPWMGSCTRRNIASLHSVPIIIVVDNWPPCGDLRAYKGLTCYILFSSFCLSFRAFVFSAYSFIGFVPG